MAVHGLVTTRRVHRPALAADAAGRLIPLIYEAALAPDRWPALLAALTGAFGGIAAGLRVAAGHGRPRMAFSHGYAAAAVRDYDAAWGHHDPVLAGGGWPAPATTRQMAGPGPEQHPFFRGWMRPSGIDDELCLGLVAPGGAQRIVLGIARPAGWTRFGPADVSALARLAPHLRRAVEVQRRLAGETRSGALAAMLDHLAQGVVLADADGALSWANRAALALLAAADGIALDHRGRLRVSPAAQAALQAALAAALGGEGVALPLARPSGKPPLTLLAVPLPRQVAASPLWPDLLPARLMLLLNDPAQAASDGMLERRLRALWGLTATEALVAAQAAHGLGLPEVAQALGLAVTTTRTHAQRVFAKAGLHGQAELARQVERLRVLADAVPTAMPGALAHRPPAHPPIA